MKLTDIQHRLLAAIIEEFDRAEKVMVRRDGIRALSSLHRNGIGVFMILAQLRLDARPLRALGAKGAIRLMANGRKVTPETSAFLAEFRAAPTMAGRKAVK